MRISLPQGGSPASSSTSKIARLPAIRECLRALPLSGRAIFLLLYGLLAGNWSTVNSCYTLPVSLAGGRGTEVGFLWFFSLEYARVCVIYWSEEGARIFNSKPRLSWSRNHIHQLVCGCVPGGVLLSFLFSFWDGCCITVFFFWDGSCITVYVADAMANKTSAWAH